MGYIYKNYLFQGLLLIEPIAILAEDLDTLNDSVIYSLVDGEL